MSNGKASGWVEWVGFAGVILTLNGILNVIQGLVALIGPNAYYTVANGSLFIFDVTGWGWWNLLIGALQVATGISLFLGQGWARIVAVIFASISVIGHMLLLPAQPWWSVIAIALNVLVIYALTVHGKESERVARG